MEIVDLVKSKKLVFTSELGPPKGTNLEELFKKADLLKSCVDAINVTDGQAAVMRLGSLACCIRLKERGVNPIMQVTVRDRNRMALQSELLSAGVFDIKNILVLTGDPLKIGDHPDAKPVFDIDAIGLLDVLTKLESGVDMAGKKLNGTPQFCIAAAANPCVDDLEVEFSKLHNKVKHGTEFFQTQGIFDLERFGRFIARYEKEGFKQPLLAGIILLKSAKMARFMNEKIPGVVIPEAMIKRLEQAKDAKAECVDIACGTMQALKSKVQGFHLMAIGWEELIPQIIKKAA